MFNIIYDIVLFVFFFWLRGFVLLKRLMTRPYTVFSKPSIVDIIPKKLNWKFSTLLNYHFGSKSDIQGASTITQNPDQ